MGETGLIGMQTETETGLKNRLRTVIGGWSEAYEPGAGSGVGYPDLMFLADGILIPVEVKKGRVIEGRLISDRIRPAQISWHHRFIKSGGLSFIFVCFLNAKKLNVWVAPLPWREVTSQWRRGWEVERCKQIIWNNLVVTDLFSLVAMAKKEKNFLSG